MQVDDILVHFHAIFFSQNGHSRWDRVWPLAFGRVHWVPVGEVHPVECFIAM